MVLGASKHLPFSANATFNGLPLLVESRQRSFAVRGADSTLKSALGQKESCKEVWGLDGEVSRIKRTDEIWKVYLGRCRPYYSFQKASV